MTTDVQPLVTKYCAKCHSGAKPKADLNFDKYRDAQSILTDRDAWEAVIENIETQVMPPERSPKPSADELAEIHHAIEKYQQKRGR